MWTGSTKQVLETGLEAELSEHLGYDKHAAEGRDGGNSLKDSRSKTVLTEMRPVSLDVPARPGGFVRTSAGEQAPAAPVGRG